MNFETGKYYSVADIQGHLQVGNSGGIRVSLSAGEVRRIVLLTVAPSAKVARENPYHDRIEGGVLVYSAAGLDGDQFFSGQNKRLSDQPRNLFPIYGFRLNKSRRKTGIKRWEFLGLLQFLRVYPANHLDRQKNLRRSWMFELRVCSELTTITLAEEAKMMASQIKEFNFDVDKETREPIENPVIETGDPKLNAEAIEKTRSRLFELEPRGFELLVEKALNTAGFDEVTVTRYTQDNGIDVNAIVSNVHWAIAGLRVQVQVKRWLHTVGRREVAELRGSLEPFANGAVVTTSFFSKAAVAESKAPGRSPIVLVDGYQFASIARAHALLE